MSVITSRSKRSSILKGSTLKSRLNDSKTPVKVRFQLPHSQKIAYILKNYLQGQNIKEYEQLVILIRDSEFLDDDIEELLHEATECISLLGHGLRLFVDAILSIKWTDRSHQVVENYQSFLCNLLVAHNYHTKNVIDRLVSHFIPDNDEDWVDGIPKEEDLQTCLVIHNIFSVLINIIPMCKEVMLESLIHHFPFYNKSAHTHEYYLHNLLWIIEYMPQFRSDLLHLIFSKLVVLDAHAPREDIEKHENDEEIAEECIFMMETEKSKNQSDSNKLKHLQGHTLDVCMLKMLNYFIMQCYPEDELDWDKAKELYQWMIIIFDKVILPTYKIHHVQFVMFFLCSFKTSITEAFLNYLWKKVCTPNVASVLRQTAVAYIASLVARASFVPLVMLKGTLQQMSEWIHCYISSQDATESINLDVRTHATFYSVCQALFYIIAFRQKDLLNNRKNISFISTLHLGKIVTCRLNPLRVCQPAVVAKFAAVTRTYQLAYCYAILEHNERNFLPCIYQTDQGCSVMTKELVQSFFPFDPYILKQSCSKIHPFYIEYNDNVKEKETDKCDEAEDDFLCENSSPSKKAKFSYSSSPGFKYKT